MKKSKRVTIIDYSAKKKEEEKKKRHGTTTKQTDGSTQLYSLDHCKGHVLASPSSALANLQQRKLGFIPSPLFHRLPFDAWSFQRCCLLFYWLQNGGRANNRVYGACQIYFIHVVLAKKKRRRKRKRRSRGRKKKLFHKWHDKQHEEVWWMTMVTLSCVKLRIKFRENNYRSVGLLVTQRISLLYYISLRCYNELIRYTFTDMQ